MQRFYIQKEAVVNNTACIEGSEARHIGKVLRMCEQDSIHLFDEDGTVYAGTIIRKDKQRILVRIDDRCAAPERDDKEIILGQALPKAMKMDLIVQKATELGVSRIIPFSSMRTVARYDSKREQDKIRHWRQIAVASAQQSGMRYIPAIEGVAEFKDLVGRNFDGCLKIILWEEEKKSRLRKVIQQSRDDKKIIFLVGPEGGFAPEEAASAQERGFNAASLGDAVLRTETVSLAVLSILRYEAGDFG
jgi:16S rRNA (uracil1498-N3)-methyltransferase